MMRRVKKIFILIIGVLFYFGCDAVGVPDTNINLKKEGENIVELNTIYSSVLPKLNKMIEVFRNEPINIYVLKVQNETADKSKVPPDITFTVKDTFSKVGNFVNVIYNPDNNELIKKHPFLIEGAITEFDMIESKNRGLDGSGTGTVGKNRNVFDTDGSLDSEYQKMVLGLRLMPIDNDTGNYISRKSASNRIIIEKKGSANEFAFSILGTGFGFSNAIVKSQGIHTSISALVELTVAELLGKIGDLPYWFVMKGGKVDYDVLNARVNEFMKEPLNKKIEQVSYLLNIRGKDVEVSRVMTPKKNKAIIEFKKEHGLPADNTLSREFFIELLKI